MPVINFNAKNPDIHQSIFLAPDAWIIGDVEVGELCSVFFGAVLRGDINSISVGARTNIQEHAVLHTSTGLTPCLVGEQVTVGHRAILHGCKIERLCIIGMGAVILDGAHIGEQSIVGAQALVPMGFTAPPRSMILGVPAKIVRTLREDELPALAESSRHYVEKGTEYREKFQKLEKCGD